VSTPTRPLVRHVRTAGTQGATGSGSSIEIGSCPSSSQTKNYED
jgi:hypothetical protein